MGYVAIALLPDAHGFIDRARDDGFTCVAGGDPLDGIHVPRMSPQRGGYRPARRILPISANMKPPATGVQRATAQCAPKATRPDVGDTSAACGVRLHPTETKACSSDTAILLVSVAEVRL